MMLGQGDRFRSLILQAHCFRERNREDVQADVALSAVFKLFQWKGKTWA
jgi:hypothetical protein